MNKTINDIAKLAGVAKSTVSRYLNGGHVSERTKKRIKEVIEETKYEPNTFAQSLKSKRTNFIGVIAPALDSFVTSRILMSIDEQLRNLKYTSLIINTSQNHNLEIQSLLQLQRQKVDGIILVATTLTKEHLETIKSLHTPVLIVGQRADQVHSIILNDYVAGKTLGQLVAESGHSSVGYLGVTEVDQAVGVVRKQGVLHGLQEQGVHEVNVYQTSFDFNDAYNAVKELVVSTTHTALICATDTIALGAMKAAHEMGINIPQELSICGFGGYTFSSVTVPPLTTVRFNYEEAGKLAAESIIKLTLQQDIPLHQKIGFSLIEGKSIHKV